MEKDFPKWKIRFSRDILCISFVFDRVDDISTFADNSTNEIIMRKDFQYNLADIENIAVELRIHAAFTLSYF